MMCVCVHVRIYIYIHTEKQRERQKDIKEQEREGGTHVMCRCDGVCVRACVGACMPPSLMLTPFNSLPFLFILFHHAHGREGSMEG